MADEFSFGRWLQRRRKALDLTQAELAQRVSCAPETLRKIEADVRRPSRQLAEQLAHRLGLRPSEQRPSFELPAKNKRSTPSRHQPKACPKLPLLLLLDYR
jgi:transcriptional regulator with XRE-family HTH domain